ncbi:radical SAM protein [Enterorhabdus sp. P55]|uniref:radical SAM protein n=1 Tax=Enterorhabdus sp. P55 TaxID=2304571 RepID=UPI001367C49F|nr:radical SAM protein [Enterorhabdus sp. P55]NBI33162.1 radical SAM protein [Enterorhabdus sp. P55]
MRPMDFAKRTAANKLVDYLCEDPARNMGKVMDKINALCPESLFPAQREAFTHVVADPDNNMYQLIMRLMDLNPAVRNDLLKTFLVDANLVAWGVQEKMREKYQCNIPWAILLDPTSACNLRCTGCWAAEYGHKLNLTYEEIDSIICQGKELGVHIYIYTGGEPLVRKHDLIRLCEAHPDCAFLCFTNSTLIDEEFCQDMIRVKNFVPAISAEGDEAATDGRRGEGVYQKVDAAMDLLRSHGLPFGVSICYTHDNAASVASEAYFDWLIEKGALFAWIFSYMPVGVDAPTSLMPDPVDRERLYRFNRQVRATKPILTLDFQHDGEFVGGCIAGGRRYLHINAAGDVEPCVFIHYSNANIRERSLLDCLRSPIFMAYYEGQPFNDNLLRPCPMLENPDCLEEMVERSGAHCTDLQAQESAHDLAEKCRPAARAWAPVAERLWTDLDDERAALRNRACSGLADSDLDRLARQGRVMRGAFDPERAVDEYALDPELREELADALDGGAALAEADAALEAPAVAAPASMRRAS